MIEGEHDQVIGRDCCKRDGVIQGVIQLTNPFPTEPSPHPAVTDLLKHFSYDHLPEHLQWISQPFHDLAHNLAYNLDLSGPELTVGLRKLLEAKDCAVRAAL